VWKCRIQGRKIRVCKGATGVVRQGGRRRNRQRRTGNDKKGQRRESREESEGTTGGEEHGRESRRIRELS
jgi:hypothetical protein